jgi:hypothetical protein
METKRVYFVRIGGAVRGPLTSEDLRDLAAAELVMRESDIALSADGPWAPLATQEVCAVVFPPRRVLGFKATEFVEVNRSAAPAVDLNEVIERANRPAPALRGREVTVAPLGKLGAREGDPLNDVQQIVLEVGRKVAENAPPIALPGPVVPFPRWRWFAVAAVLGSAGFMSIPWFYRRPYDAMSVSILLGWVVMFNALLLGLMMLDRKLSDAVRRDKTKMDSFR